LPPRLRLGALQSSDWKGMRVRPPDGWGDVSPARLVWDSGEAAEASSLVVERVATPWTPSEIEGHLLAGGFGGPPLEETATRARPAAGRARDRFGTARGPGTETEHAILDLGTEKLVARFSGPPETVAYNRSVLRRSLESLEADPLLVRPVAAPVEAPFEGVALPEPGAPAFVLPAGWVRERSEGAQPPLLPPADAGFAASPPGDFTVSCQALWWRERAATPEQAAARRGQSAPAGSAYALRESRLGVVYRVDGVFLDYGGGLLRLEVRAPEEKSAYLAGVLPAWRRALEAR
jgi:hypothetical protein